MRSNPLRVSAPLPPSWELKPPSPAILRAEVLRATNELMWALHRQRAAWAKMSQVKEDMGTRNIEFIDNERKWKLATGDVTWWRGEVSSRSNALTALLSLAAATGIEIGHGSH